MHLLPLFLILAFVVLPPFGIARAFHGTWLPTGGDATDNDG